ncbi:MAG: LamG-like jellyroll fold domain-containing protein, partial [Pirellulales bacterium]
DAFIAEPIEVIDWDSGEFRADPPAFDHSTIQPRSADPVIDVPDRQLTARLASELNIPITTAYDGSPLVRMPFYASDLNTITRLAAGAAGIQKLDGLGFATNLRQVNLAGNSINDTLGGIQPLRAQTDRTTGAPIGLTRLERLSLDFNTIADLSPLAGLTGLDFLSIDAQQSGAVPGAAAMGAGPSQPLPGLVDLAELTNLKWLSLYGNEIVDVSPLGAMSRLEYLDLRGNLVRNIDALAGERILDDGGPGTTNSYSVLPALLGNNSFSWLTNLRPVADAFEGGYQFAPNDGGGVLIDASPARHHAILGAGDPTKAPLIVPSTADQGQFTTALKLDGVDDFLLVDGSDSSIHLDADRQLTFEAWIYPTGPGSDATTGGILVNKEGEYEVARFADGTIRWAFANVNPGWSWVDTGFVAPQDTWTHLAIVYDVASDDGSGRIDTYANGALVHSFAGATGAIEDFDTALNELRIGGRQGGAASQIFEGQIDEVRLWNVARSEAAIVATNDAPLQGNEQGLAGYWPFDDSPLSVASWRFEGVPTGDYDVQVSWPRGNGRASNATYTVFDGSTTLTNVTVDQRVPPLDDLAHGQLWKSLGTFRAAGGQFKVDLTNVADGLVAADAVRLVASQSPRDSLVRVDLEGNALDNRAHELFVPALQTAGASVLFDPNPNAPVIQPIGPQPTDGRLLFDGLDDQVTIPGFPGVTGTAARSVTAWIKTTNRGNHSLISWGQDTGPGEEWTIRVQDTDGTAGAIRVDVGGGYVVGNTNIADGQWHHVAVTWAGGGTPDITDARLYVDGVQETFSASQSQTINTAAGADVRIGSDF